MGFSANKNTIILSAVGISTALIMIIMGKTIISRGSEIRRLQNQVDTSNEELQRTMDNLRNEQQDKGRITEEFNLEHVELEYVRQALEEERENVRRLRETIAGHDQLERRNQELLQNIQRNTAQMQVLQNRTPEVIEAEIRQEIQDRAVRNPVELARMLAYRVRIRAEVDRRIVDRDNSIHDLEVQNQGFQDELLQIQANRADLQNQIRDLNRVIEFMTNRQALFNDILIASENKNTIRDEAQRALTKIEADYQLRINNLNERIRQLEHEQE